jgi:hypothetical protein
MMPRTPATKVFPGARRGAVWALMTISLLLGLSILPRAAASSPNPPGKNHKHAPARRASASPKFLPPDGSTDESDAIHERVTAEWKLLTYPKTTIPSEPFTKARRWVQAHVDEGQPWPDSQKGLAAEDTGSSLVAPATGSWTLMGPKPIDMSTQSSGYTYGLVTGRFNVVAIDPRTTNNPGAIVAYAGTAAGGLWKTANCCGSGTTWTPLWETNGAVTQAVGAIDLDPNNANVIYAGTGDFDANDQFGEGIMKSTDAGQTWTQLATNVFTPFAAGTPLWPEQNIGVIKTAYNNGNNVVAGTSHDLYISHDAGQSWARCPFGANPTDPTSASNPIRSVNQISAILRDVSTNPTTIYVAVGYPQSTGNGDNGVYKGTIPDTGCPALTLMNWGWPFGTGNGTNGGSSVGRIRLTASRGNFTGSLTLYAQVQDAFYGNALVTLVSTDLGNTWAQLVGTQDYYYGECHGAMTNEKQDSYDLFILADPGNDRIVYIGRTSLYQMTVDSFYSFASLQNLANVYSISPACPGYGTMHPDMHGAAWVSGTGAGTSLFLVANDGGMWTANGAVGGFTSLNQTINATEFYAGQTGPNLAGGATQYLFSGNQDNGTASWDSSDTTPTWQARGNGGDGFFAAFDPIGGTLNAGNWYAEYVFGKLQRSTTGAAGAFIDAAGNWASDRPAWSSPFRVDIFHGTNTSCQNLIFGAAHLYASTDGATTWTMAGAADLTKGVGSNASIASLDFAPSSPAAAVVGTGDGNVQWASNVLAGSNCTLAAANTAAFSCSVNGSPTWVNLTQGNAVLPNRAILGVTFDPGTVNKVYAAVGGFNENTPSTPGHVYQATNNAGTWSWLDKTGNLPDVPADTVLINPANANQAFVGTHMGFYYTDNVNVATPTWYRYQYGLPDTVVKFLAVDRGPQSAPYSSTTLTAFTYGRGTFSIRLPGTTGFPPRPLPTTLTAKRNGSDPSKVDVAFDSITCPDVNNNLYWGAIGNYTTITGGVCHLGASGSATGLAIPNGSWWVIAGTDDGGIISSFGLDSHNNQERFTGWSGVCSETAQNTTTSCP